MESIAKTGFIVSISCVLFFQQVQEELRSVRTQLDEILGLGQELVSRSEKYSKLVGPDIENITRKFEDIQRRIRVIQVGDLFHRILLICAA